MNIYIYTRTKSSTIYHSITSVTSKINQIQLLNSHSHVQNKSNSTSQLSSMYNLMLYSCHPGGTTFEPYMYSKWVDTVPLSNVRGPFPSLVTPWEGNPNLSPIRKGAVPVSNQRTAGHSLQSVDQWSQSPICQPVQITIDWPIKWLSSRDGTYISVSCNDHNTFQYTNPFQYFNITSTSSILTIPFNISISTFQYFPSTYSPTSQIQHLILFTST